MKNLKKWYTYQKERFPILVYGLYVFCIAIAVFGYCNYLQIAQDRLNANNPIITLKGSSMIKDVNWVTLIPMFIVAILQFLMVRIVDEFKDYEEDLKYRPYRPVPRGLIKLEELKILFIICAIIQIILTLIFNKKEGILYLIILWTYFALMSKEFFQKKIIDKHILYGVLLDELLMPILVIYLASFVYIDYSKIWIILIISYIISWIVEIARKIRCKEDEEKGVKTYTAVFGIKKATLLLWALEAIVLIINTFIPKISTIHIITFIITSIINILFMTKKNKKLAKLTEISANLYITIIYLNIGLIII